MSILDFLYPPKCKICNTRIKKGAVCPFCFARIAECYTPIKRIILSDGGRYEGYVLFPYKKDVIKSLLFALKKNANKELFKHASELYLRAFGEDDGVYAVVNVPRRRENIRKYGYDHVKEPCKIMCKSKENLIFAPILKRRGGSVDQKELDRSGRLSNVKGKFRALKKDIPQNILLVDDVVTTSSTASECIRELKSVYPDAKIKCIFLAETSLSDFSCK